MVNMTNLLNGKDSRWLQLEVCREFQRNKCTRQDTECKFAHPPANVEVQNGKVTACYDSIKVSFDILLCLFDLTIYLTIFTLLYYFALFNYLLAKSRIASLPVQPVIISQWPFYVSLFILKSNLRNVMMVTVESLTLTMTKVLHNFSLALNALLTLERFYIQIAFSTME